MCMVVHISFVGFLFIAALMYYRSLKNLHVRCEISFSLKWISGALSALCPDKAMYLSNSYYWGLISDLCSCYGNLTNNLSYPDSGWHSTCSWEREVKRSQGVNNQFPKESTIIPPRSQLSSTEESTIFPLDGPVCNGIISKWSSNWSVNPTLNKFV